MLLPPKSFTRKWSLRVILSNSAKFVVPIDPSKDVRHLKNFVYGYIKQIFGCEYRILTVLDSEGFFLAQNFKIKDVLKNRDTIHCFDTELSVGDFRPKEEIKNVKVQIVCDGKSNLLDVLNKHVKDNLEDVESLKDENVCSEFLQDKSKIESIVRTPSKHIEKKLGGDTSSILEQKNIKKEKNESFLHNKELKNNSDVEKNNLELEAEKRGEIIFDSSQIGIKKKRKSKDSNKTDEIKEMENSKIFEKNEETKVDEIFDQKKSFGTVINSKLVEESKINVDSIQEKSLVESEVKKDEISKEFEEETDNENNGNKKIRVVRKTALKKETFKNSLPKISKSRSVNSTPKKNIETEVKMVSARKTKKKCDFSLDEI